LFEYKGAKEKENNGTQRKESKVINGANTNLTEGSLITQLIANKGNRAALQMLNSGTDSVIQKKNNNTGMPDNLKAGIERMSGIDISDVKVNYNSSKPAEVGALATTQGNQIHIASGQEKHLPHEAWHTVQQKQNRVKPTMSVGGVAINDSSSLENEATVMGNRAMQMKADVNGIPEVQKSSSAGITQRKLKIEASVGSGNWLEKVEASLSRLTGDGALKFSKVGWLWGNLGYNKTVHAGAKIEQAREVHPKSVELLERVIGSDKLTTITHGASNVADPQLNNQSGLPARQAAGNGTGSDVKVTFNPDDPGMTTVRNATDDGEVVETTPNEIMLGHELIHSDHFQRGVGKFDAKGNMKQSYFKAAYDNTTMGPEKEEEIHTVGLPPSTGEQIEHQTTLELETAERGTKSKVESVREDWIKRLHSLESQTIVVVVPETGAITENMLRAEHSTDEKPIRERTKYT